MSLNVFIKIFVKYMYTITCTPSFTRSSFSSTAHLIVQSSTIWHMCANLCNRSCIYSVLDCYVLDCYVNSKYNYTQYLRSTFKREFFFDMHESFDPVFSFSCPAVHSYQSFTRTLSTYYSLYVHSRSVVT